MASIYHSCNAAAVRLSGRSCTTPPARPLSSRAAPQSSPIVLNPLQFPSTSPVLVLRSSIIVHAKGGKGGGKGDAKSGKSDSKSGGGAGAGGDEAFKLTAKAKADAEDRMKKCLASVSENYNTIRTGRANPAILDKVMVDYFGTATPLKQVAAITIPDAFTLMVSPFDVKALKDIEKALNISELGLTPNNDGERIRLGLPSLTQDRRKVLAKQVKEFTEDGKVAVRNVRKDAMKKAEKLDPSKDGAKGMEDDIQKLTDLYVKKLDDMLKAKSDEVMKL